MNTDMEVLVLGTDAFSRGGVQRYTHLIARAMGEIMGEQSVRLFTVVERDTGPETLGFSYLGGGGRSPGLRAKIGFTSLAPYHVARRRPDLILCTHVNVTPVALLAKMLFGIRYYTSAHGIEVWDDLPWLKETALRRSDLILAVSGFTRDRLIKDQRIDPLSCGLANPVVRGDAAAEVCGRPMILTVGRISSEEQYKGQDVVIRSLPAILKEVPGACYVIVGEGDDRDRLERLARESGVRDSVFFTGWVDEDELPAYYHACDVFAMPSRVEEHGGKWTGEGFGIAYIEAAAFGKPVVAGIYGGSGEAVLDRETGFLVDPTDADQVASVLTRLLKDKSLARGMGTRGKEWVTTNFTFEVFKKTLQDLIDVESVTTS
jgi:glycosyltransferase involved in cell wall biosynthesis